MVCQPDAPCGMHSCVLITHKLCQQHQIWQPGRHSCHVCALPLYQLALFGLAGNTSVCASAGSKAASLTQSFGELTKDVVKDPFIRNWLDLLCFLLSGLPADGTIAAEVCVLCWVCCA